MPIDPAKLYDDGDIRLRVVAHVLAFMADRTTVTQNEIARRAGVKSGRLSRFMTGARGEKHVSVGLVMRLATAIESTPSHILREPPPQRFYEEAKRRAHESDARAASPPDERKPPRQASRESGQSVKPTTGAGKRHLP